MFHATHRQENAHQDSVWSVFWTSRNQIVSGSVDETAKIWSDSLIPTTFMLEGHRLGVVSVKATSDGSTAVTSSMDSCIRFWDLDTGEEIESRRIEAKPVEAWTLDISPNDQLLASGTEHGMVNLFSMEKAEKVASLGSREKFVMSVAFSPDGRKVASGGLDGLINLYDVGGQRLIQKLEGHAMPIRSLKFSPDGLLLYTASDDMRINVYDVKRHSLVTSFTGHTSLVLCVDTSPDGRHFVSSGSDRTVRVWDMAAKECVHVFDAEHSDQVWSVAYSPDGTRIVSGGDDRVLQVYDLGNS